MKAIHRLTIKAKCPVNGRRDTYAMTVITRKTLRVEDIIQVAKEEGADPVFQEELTECIATRLGCKVITVGKHSGVETKVVSRA